MPGQVHHGDIDPGLAERLADETDHARAILVVQHQDLPLGDRLDDVAVDPHDAVILIAEQGAADEMLAVAATYRQPDQAGIPFAARAFGLDHTDAALAGQVGSVDVVDLRPDHRRQQPLEGRSGQRFGREAGHRASVFQPDFLQLAGVKLRLEGAEGFRQREVGAQGVEQFGADRRHVDRVDNHATLQKIDDLPGDLDGDVDLGIQGGGAQMWGTDHLFEGEQGIVAVRRFLGEDVDGRPGNVTCADGFGQGDFVD